MRRILLLPVVLSCALFVPPAPAADDDTPPATTATADGNDVHGIVATVNARANIRYGPSVRSRVICTLNAGDPVSIVGPAPVPDWYTIRFPEQGHAWVHKRNLEAVDGGKRWRVKSDCNARSDSTLRGDLVAQLKQGEILEDRAQTRGDWVAVSIPSAVAYVHKSLVNLPDGAAIAQQQATAAKLAQVWADAQARYAEIYRQLQPNPGAAASIDWAPLLKQLDQVAQGHPEPAVRMNAKRLLDAITAVVQKIQAGGGTGGDTHVASGGTTGEASGGTTTTTAPSSGGASGSGGSTVATATPPPPTTSPTDGTTTGGSPLGLPPGSDHPTHDTTATPPVAAPTPAPAVAYAAVGFITENTDYPKVPAHFLVMDSNSQVIAFLTPKAGTTLNLGEYDMRWVGVEGSSEPLDAAQTGLKQAVPLIQVAAVHLVQAPPASP